VEEAFAEIEVGEEFDNWIHRMGVRQVPSLWGGRQTYAAFAVVQGIAEPMELLVAGSDCIAG